MALEDLTGSNKYIANLVNTNPLAADDRREGDDHIRGIKNVLLNTFPGIGAPINFGNYVLKAGDTMTGMLRISPVSGVSQFELDAAPGFNKQIGLLSNGVARWAILSDAAADDFVVARFNNAGAYLGPTLSVNRASGQVSTSNEFAVGGPSMYLGAQMKITVAAAVNTTLRFLGQADLVCQAAQGDLDYGVNGTWCFSSKGVSGDWWIRGQGYKPAGGVWGDTSDARIKENVEDYTRGLDAVLALRPVSYNFSAQTQRDTSVRYIGLIAQEAEIPMPEMVTRRQETIGAAAYDDLRFMDATALTYALVNAVKTLAARVEALELAAAGVGRASL